MQVWWRSGHLRVRRNDLCRSLGYRQTDGRTDDGRRAIALAHYWNEHELKITLTALAGCLCDQDDVRGRG